MIGHNSSQTIFRSNPAENFTILSNDMLRDSRISYESRGLLGDLLSRPDDWEINIINIAKSGPAGRDKVYRMMRELEDAGYAKRDADRRGNGSYLKHKYMVSDNPELLIERTAREIDSMMKPHPEKPKVVVPFPGKPEVAKRMKMAENKPLPRNQEVDNELWQPLPEKPLTANPTQTKNIDIQRTDIVSARRPDATWKSIAASGLLTVAEIAGINAAAADVPREPLAIEIQDLDYWGTMAKLRKAAGEALNTTSTNPAWGNLSVIKDWMAKGWSLEDDILPGIASCKASAGVVNSWRYYGGAIAAYRQQRLSPLPKPTEKKKVRSFADQEADEHKAWIMREADKIAARGPLLPREE